MIELAGMWFYWDEAPPGQRAVFHGRVVGMLPDARHYLVRFDPHEQLRAGLHELVEVDRMARERWSFFETEEALRAAL